MKTSAEARIRNRAYRSRLRAAVRELRTESSKEVAAKTYREVVSLIDGGVRRRLLHRNNAARQKSRLASFVRKMA